MKCLVRDRLVLALFALVGAAGPASAAEVVTADGNGAVHTLLVGEKFVPIRANLYLPAPGWKRLVTLDNARDVRSSSAAGRRTWSGRIEAEPGRFCRYDVVIQEVPGQVSMALRVTAESDVTVEGAFFWLEMPIAVFAGGNWQMVPEKSPAEILVLPHRQTPVNPLASGAVRRMVLADLARELRVEVSLDRVYPVNVQDNRQFGSPTYGALVQFHQGVLAKGQAASLEVKLDLGSRPPGGAAVLTLHAAERRYDFDGFGGNYCFGIDSPVAAYTLKNLRSVWARSEMLLREWEPANDNASASEVKWDAFKANDRPGSKLRQRFLLDRQLHKQGLRLILSVWHLPNWLYADPENRSDNHGRRLAPDQWPEMLECVGSYLLHEKREYGVEPELFSFNEPDIGVYVRFSAEEQRDLVRRAGALFQKLGLKTRLLLGDTHSPRDTHVYAQPTADEPQAARFVGALAFHSWGGATREQYKAWPDLAAKLRVPLLVTEMGVDPEAWRTGMFDRFAYGLREARMIQELLLYARPQSLLYWEYTSDYGLVRESRPDPRKEPVLTPTARCWLIKQFSDLTPPGAAALMSGSNQEDVLVTAFSRGGSEPALTLHILNSGQAREAMLFGIPPTVTTLRAVRTSETEALAELPAVEVKRGGQPLSLAARSLLTLTTLPK